MSHDEFWNDCDYDLVESFIKRNEMVVEAETESNWELIQYIRVAMFEIASLMNQDKKSNKKGIEFPKKPSSRTRHGHLNDERNKNIDNEIKRIVREKFNT